VNGLEDIEAGIQKMRRAHALQYLQQRAPDTGKFEKIGGGTLFHGCASNVVEHTRGLARLAFCDPPFGIGEPYDGFDDNAEPAEHVAQTWGLQHCCAAAVASIGFGLIAWHVPEAMLFPVLDSARAHSLELWRQVVRTFGFGVFIKSRWINGHENLLMFNPRGWTPIWNPEAVLEQSERLKTGDKRTTTSQWKGWRPPSTVWPFARIQGNNGERWKKHPNQLPLAYLARLVLAHTNEGDLVFDACAGSGSLWLVCNAAGRQYVGAEISHQNFVSACSRVYDSKQQALAERAVEGVTSWKK
jgi:hypothetical protein